jgi:hypothetical protein
MAMFPEPKRLEHWQMSPEQFDNDPNTVFHASFYEDPRNVPAFTRTHAGIHAGTEQSALERAGALFPFREDLAHPGAKLADPDSSNPRIGIHRWHLAEMDRVKDPLDDDAANDPYTEFDRPTAYENATEDRGSLSVRIDHPRQAMTHEDLVSNALEDGADPTKMHPLTRHLYETGKLHGPRLMSDRDVHNEVSPASMHDQHNGGLFPFTRRPRSGGIDVRPGVVMSREEVADLVSGPNNRDTTLDRFYDPNVRLGDNATAINAAESEYGRRSGTAVNLSTWAIPERRSRVSDRGDIRRGQQFRGAS